MSWINSHQNLSTPPFPSTWKLRKQKSTLQVLTKKTHFLEEKCKKLGKNCTISFCNKFCYKVQLKGNPIHLIWFSNSSLGANEAYWNINITRHAQILKNQLFSDLTKSLQIFTKSWRKVSWINTHQNLSTLLFRSTWKLRKQKKYFARFDQKNHFLDKKCKKMGKNCTISFCN